MSWSESSPGLYQRPLGLVETGVAGVLAAGLPREPLLIHSVADFTSSAPTNTVAQAFRDAWKALRLLKSPDIATSLKDGIKSYNVPTSSDLEVWLNQTYAVAETGSSVQSVIRKMFLRLENMPVLYLVPQPTQDGTFTGSVILFVSHWRTEAGGSLKVLNQLFDYASDLQSGASTRDALSKHTLGDETALLTPALEDIVMPNKQSTPEATARVEKHFADFYAQLPTFSFHMRDSASATPSSMKVYQRTYTTSSTSSLVNACRAKQVTVTSAIHAAYLGAVWQVTEPSMQSRAWTCIMPAEVRKRLPASSPFRDQGCWNAAQLLLIHAPAGQDFVPLARDLRRQYGVANEHAWMYEDMRETSARTMELGSNSSPDQPKSMPFFTSLGVLDGDVIVADHNAIKIGYVMAWADTEGPGIVMRVHTFNGRLNIHIAWNSGFHGDDQIHEVMDILDGILAKELGVDIGVEEVRLMEC